MNTTLFGDFDARYTSWQADCLCRMIAAITGTDEAYHWLSPQTSEGSFEQMKFDWTAQMKAVLAERKEDAEFGFEQDPDDYLRRRPAAKVVDGKLAWEADSADQDVLTLLTNVTLADLLKTANAGAAAAQEWLRDSIFEVIDAGDRFSSSSLGETTRKAFEAETCKIVAGYKAV